MMARDHDGLPLVIMAAVPILAMQIGVGFVHFQAERKRSVRRFRRELISAGMSREQAARLAQAYHDAGSVRQMLRGARFPRM